MINLNSEIHLTDELERQLMQQAMEEQARFKPGTSLKNLFVKLSQGRKSAKADAVVTREAKHAI
ncbi:hypothetical protein H0484_01950 [Pusillimonas sp. CC-YST705]|uniref:Uncharacterized protein n=1 Tax=Mesopusillimonas faecipullorum TaxID=2755040 RepID=A0ABS8C921_9BURK|nr:hypothetical protein [Mesopusillimonas faecipullorum]MCB5362520.1 hypothetical protein [Mesopusillimonas faecipullorum]